MSDLKESVLRDFDGYVNEFDIQPSLSGPARLFVQKDVDEFLEQERSYGLGKTRRPNWNHRYFDEQIARARELKRREQEDLNRLFGE